MQYLLLIYDNESTWGAMTDAERGGMYQQYGTFTKEIAASGHSKGGHQLHPVSKAKARARKLREPGFTSGETAQ